MKDSDRIEVRESASYKRWTFYIDGERRGSAPSKAAAEKEAKKLLRKMTAAPDEI